MIRTPVTMNHLSQSVPKPRNSFSKQRLLRSAAKIAKQEAREDLARTNDLFICQRALHIHEPSGPRAMRLAQTAVQANTKVRETLNFPPLAYLSRYARCTRRKVNENCRGRSCTCPSCLHDTTIQPAASPGLATLVDRYETCPYTTTFRL